MRARDAAEHVCRDRIGAECGDGGEDGERQILHHRGHEGRDERHEHGEGGSAQLGGITSEVPCGQPGAGCRR